MSETENLFQLVVVGSSAGGIEALSKLVASLGEPFPVPLVIAQHLDPTRPSHLGKILSRHSPLPVVVVENEEKLLPGTVYVVPSNNHVEITDHEVRILQEAKGRPKPSVDLLLTTASQVYGEKLIAVILTGTGSDGKLGVRSVHDSGGTVIAQNPATAAYPGMSQSLDPQTVDIVADLPQIGSLLCNLVNGKPVPFQFNTGPELEPFLEQLRASSGIDFRSYKPGTILRRLQRRMEVTNSNDLRSYQDYLTTHPEESEQLVNSFLIKVTEFMRDPTLFAYLQEQILPALIEYSRGNNHELRLWSAGCATGQEAYSLAILLCEVLGDKLKDFNIKIFATDVDANAIASARRGFYTADNLDGLSPQLLENYFVREREGYSVKKQIRDLLVFGEHDLSQRPPFPRIDLVLCRNVLIYFSRELQQHALQLFAFALRNNGYLVLGRSENAGLVDDLFAPDEQGQRVYRRQGQRRLHQTFAPRNGKSLAPISSSRPQRQREVRNLFQIQQEVQHSRAATDNLLLKLPIGVVVVDGRFDIQEINSTARRLLSIHTAAIGEDFVHLAQHVPPRELGTAITTAIQENTVASLNRLEVPHLNTGEPTFLQIDCYPHPGIAKTEKVDDSVNNYALILIADITASTKAQQGLEQFNSHHALLATDLAQSVESLKEANEVLQQRNQQLQHSNTELDEAKQQAEAVAQRHAHQMELLIEANRNLLSANEELTTINADLRTTGEEYLLHTEEAQAAIEEADTLNEEMQATNEELETLNEELQASVEELNTSNADLAVQTDTSRQRTEELRVAKQESEEERAQLRAILSSMGDAVIVLDFEGKILLTNAAYDGLFGDVKEPVLLDEAGRQLLPTEETPQALALIGAPFSTTFSFERADGSRRWLEAFGQPVYREGAPALSVIVLRDITERSLRRLQEEFSSLVAHELRTPLTGIKGHTQLVQSWLEKRTNEIEKPLRSLKLVLSQVAQLERLITDISDTNRLQNGKFKLKFSPVRLDELLKQVVEVGKTLTSKQVVELHSDNEPLLVSGDAVRLQQLIFNLLNNAITHAPASPKIEIQLRRLNASQVEIKVRDYGPGIKAAYLTEVFSRFYQIRGGNEASKEGLGLGLYIAEQIVVAHGGTIRVESTEGEGTTFIVQLPLLQEQAEK